MERRERRGGERRQNFLQGEDHGFVRAQQQDFFARVVFKELGQPGEAGIALPGTLQ